MTAKKRRLKASDLAEFLKVTDDWKKHWQVADRAVYRGHGDCNWILVAKLFRDPDATPENRDGDSPVQIEKQLLNEHLPKELAHQLERTLLNGFVRFLYAQRPDLAHVVPGDETSVAGVTQRWWQLTLAQHYGLPTRFIDFTTNFLVALYFAVEEAAVRRKTKANGDWHEQDSAVWCVEVAQRRPVWQVWKRNGKWLSPFAFVKEGSDPAIDRFTDVAFVPEHVDERIRVQGSVFMCEARGKKSDFTLHTRLRDKTKTVVNNEAGKEKDTRSIKVHIPSKARDSLREQLDEIGINRSTLFPGLESAARYLEWLVYQRKRPGVRENRHANEES